MDTSKLKETIKNIFWCILLLIFATIFSILGGSNLYNPNLHALGAGPSTYALGALVFTFIALICYSAVIAFLSEIITGFILKGNNNIPTIMWIITFFMFLQFANAEDPISFTLEGNSTNFRFPQFKNEAEPMLFNES